MENKEIKIIVPEGYEIDKGNSSFEKIVVFKKKSNDVVQPHYFGGVCIGVELQTDKVHMLIALNDEHEKLTWDEMMERGIETWSKEDICEIQPLWRDIMSELENVECVGKGYIMSDGITVMLGREKCKAYRNTTFMIHSVSSVAIGKLADIKDDAAEAERLNNIMIDVISKNTKIIRKKLEEVTDKRQEWYITAETALELGLIDEIID